MLDGSTMKPDFGLQAAHQLISELLGARLELQTRNLALEDRVKTLEARLADQATARPADAAP